MSEVLLHYGVKGQKWGVRRYQYADGSLTPAGKRRYSDGSGSGGLKKLLTSNVSHAANTVRTKVTGKQYVDSCLKKGTDFYRIQTSEVFEKFPFYATYKKHDVNLYLGLFGKNLMSRAERAARVAEKTANASGLESDFAEATELRSKSNNMKVYQLRLESTKKLKIPSDENAADITAKLLKESEFRENCRASIVDSKSIMKRPTQQILFNQALNAMKKDPSRMTRAEKIAVYKALNLSLVNHNPQEIAAQNRFYSELKKKGYNALLDYNDKQYSSYHAKRPMIVFDMDSVKLSSVTQADPKVVNRLNTIYNAERILKDIPTNTIGLVTRMGSKTVSECHSYVDKRVKDYLGA